MQIKTAFELAIEVDSERFYKLLDKALSRSPDVDQPEDDIFIDSSLASKGITVLYHNAPRKKKIRLTVIGEPGKLEKRIEKYFGSKYTLNDFTLSKMTLLTDINVQSRENVAAYLRVLKKVGKVKSFSPMRIEELDDRCFCLKGNSNGIEFLVYAPKHEKTILRTEVRLTKPKTIRLYTDESLAPGQVAEIMKNRERVFLDTFLRVVPFGDFHKKERTVEIIRRKVTDRTIRRRMLRLVDLVPEKKSLLLAQKALNYRRVDKVMAMFAEIGVSPVTLSKRCEVRELGSLYGFL
jgi:hypothetical protein